MMNFILTAVVLYCVIHVAADVIEIKEHITTECSYIGE